MLCGRAHVITWIRACRMSQSQKKNDVTMETEVEVMCFEDEGNVCECRHTDSCYKLEKSFQKEHHPADTDFGLLTSKTVREYICAVHTTKLPVIRCSDNRELMHYAMKCLN